MQPWGGLAFPFGGGPALAPMGPAAGPSSGTSPVPGAWVGARLQCAAGPLGACAHVRARPTLVRRAHTLVRPPRRPLRRHPQHRAGHCRCGGGCKGRCSSPCARACVRGAQGHACRAGPPPPAPWPARSWRQAAGLRGPACACLGGPPRTPCTHVRPPRRPRGRQPQQHQRRAGRCRCVGGRKGRAGSPAGCLWAVKGALTPPRPDVAGGLLHDLLQTNVIHPPSEDSAPSPAARELGLSLL